MPRTDKRPKKEKRKEAPIEEWLEASIDGRQTATTKLEGPRKWNRKLKESAEFILSSPENSNHRERRWSEGKEDILRLDENDGATTAEALYYAGLSCSYLSNQRALAAQRELVEYQSKVLEAAAQEEVERRRQLKLTPVSLQCRVHQRHPAQGRETGTQGQELPPSGEESSQETLILENKETIFNTGLNHKKTTVGSMEQPRKFLGNSIR